MSQKSFCDRTVEGVEFNRIKILEQHKFRVKGLINVSRNNSSVIVVIGISNNSKRGDTGDTVMLSV